MTQALYEAGYTAPSRFYAGATERLGMTPATYRKGGLGAHIRFAVAPCALGAVLVAASERGVCAILLGDEPEALTQELRQRFPGAALSPGDAAFAEWVAQVVGLVEVPARGLDLPLDIGGTAFQQRVWAALRAIPLGTTATYADIARAIGAPAAVRAVALACGANRLAVAIPCHRVVRSDGALSGYRWGVAASAPCSPAKACPIRSEPRRPRRFVPRAGAAPVSRTEGDRARRRPRSERGAQGEADRPSVQRLEPRHDPRTQRSQGLWTR